MLTFLDTHENHPTKRSALTVGTVVVLALVLTMALMACLGKGKLTTTESPLTAAIATKPVKPTPTPSLVPAVPQVIASVSLPAGIGDRPVDVAVSRRTGHVYVANNLSNDVSVISGTEVITTVTVGEGPKAVAFSSHSAIRKSTRSHRCRSVQRLGLHGPLGWQSVSSQGLGAIEYGRCWRALR